MDQELSRIKARAQDGGLSLLAEAVWIGPDLLVWIYGGEAPHIGAVAMAQPRASLADPERTSATASVFAYVGHKEDALAKEAAEALASALKRQGGGKCRHALGRLAPRGDRDREGPLPGSAQGPDGPARPPGHRRRPLGRRPGKIGAFLL